VTLEPTAGIETASSVAIAARRCEATGRRARERGERDEWAGKKRALNGFPLVLHKALVSRRE
jgi:hypothetical protein